MPDEAGDQINSEAQKDLAALRAAKLTAEKTGNKELYRNLVQEMIAKYQNPDSLAAVAFARALGS